MLAGGKKDAHAPPIPTAEAHDWLTALTCVIAKRSAALEKGKKSLDPSSGSMPVISHDSGTETSAGSQSPATKDAFCAEDKTPLTSSESMRDDGAASTTGASSGIPTSAVKLAVMGPFWEPTVVVTMSITKKVMPRPRNDFGAAPVESNVTARKTGVKTLGGAGERSNVATVSVHELASQVAFKIELLTLSTSPLVQFVDTVTVANEIVSSGSAALIPGATTTGPLARYQFTGAADAPDPVTNAVPLLCSRDGASFQGLHWSVNDAVPNIGKPRIGRWSTSTDVDPLMPPTSHTITENVRFAVEGLSNELPNSML